MLEYWNTSQLSFKRRSWQEKSIQHRGLSEKTGSDWGSRQEPCQKLVERCRVHIADSRGKTNVGLVSGRQLPGIPSWGLVIISISGLPEGFSLLNFHLLIWAQIRTSRFMRSSPASGPTLTTGRLLGILCFSVSLSLSLPHHPLKINFKNIFLKECFLPFYTLSTSLTSR